MDTDRWSRIQQLYHATREQPPSGRAEFLSQSCPDDPELRREVESLLAYEGQADGLLESPEWKSVGAAELAASEMASGSQLGAFRIGELLGRGGMGEVYRATDTRLNRDVAIKVLPAEYTQRDQWLSRFQHEARALASFSHPHICALYDVGPNYLVMEYLEGETLAARIEKSPLPLHEALPIAIEIAGALCAAHHKGIVHRDLKPSNIMLTGSGAKLLDFGLAKYQAPSIAGETTIAAPLGETQVLGTLLYMSPEQLEGKEADARSDIFAFGAVLYEMLTGRRALHRPSTIDTVFAGESEAPLSLHESIKGMPVDLERLIGRCLQEDPANRYGSADEVHEELKALAASLAPAGPLRLSRNAWIAVAAALVLAGLLAGWLWRVSSRQRWALGVAAPEIARLLDAGEYGKAAALTREARAVLPKDQTLQKLWMRATGEISIASVPSGADVSIRLYRGDPNAWQSLGKTPLHKVRVPLEAYVWRIVKPGFSASFVIAEPPGVLPPGFRNVFDLTLKLRPAESVPPEMVVVQGGTVRLAYPLGQAPAAQIDGFLIDRHEVTNEEYKRFVEAGGYQKREFWKQPFVKYGRTVPWDEAVALFHDATGRPGPATWEVGDYPKGREKYPVAGVSWYEAAAYAEFAGKNLPTAYHWTLASQSAGYTPLISAGSNFRSEGTQPVGGEGTLSGFGTTDMAGNVKEWCLNETRDAKRLIMGGGFGEPNYMFTHTDAQSPWDRRANFGFRCVKLDSPPTAVAAAHVEVTTRDYWNEKPVSDDVFKIYAALYAYDKGELNAQVEETATVQDWSRAKVTFDAAYGRERCNGIPLSSEARASAVPDRGLFSGRGCLF